MRRKFSPLNLTGHAVAGGLAGGLTALSHGGGAWVSVLFALAGAATAYWLTNEIPQDED